MVIKRENKNKNKENIKNNKKESDYEREWREQDEKEAREKEDAKQKKIDIANEKARVAKIITKYLDSLDEQLTEKRLFSFCAFPDRKGFKKILNDASFAEVKKFIKDSAEKYKNRYIAMFNICSKQDSKFLVEDDWLNISILVFHIDDKGNMKNTTESECWGCKVRWATDDFRISKFSFQFLENLMRIVAAKQYIFGGTLSGFRLEKVLKDLKKKRIDIGDVLNPLAGV